jgi:hypothetical protein
MSDPIEKFENVIVLGMLLGIVALIGYGFFKFNEFLNFGSTPSLPGQPQAAPTASQAAAAEHRDYLMDILNPGGKFLVDNWPAIKYWLFGSPAFGSTANDESPGGQLPVIEGNADYGPGEWTG